jgi:hypothetical protein
MKSNSPGIAAIIRRPCPLSLRERVGVRGPSTTSAVRFRIPLTLTLSRREREQERKDASRRRDDVVGVGDEVGAAD